jgi:hypothetical protein
MISLKPNGEVTRFVRENGKGNFPRENSKPNANLPGSKKVNYPERYNTISCLTFNSTDSFGFKRRYSHIEMPIKSQAGGVGTFFVRIRTAQEIAMFHV